MESVLCVTVPDVKWRGADLIESERGLDCESAIPAKHRLITNLCAQSRAAGTVECRSMASEESSARMAESQNKPGEVVPCSGIYRIVHAEHRTEHEGTLLEGEVFPGCTVCGEKVRFQLRQAANPIEQQPDFEKRAGGPMESLGEDE